MDIVRSSLCMSEDEVESVDNDIARSMASERIDFGTQSLLEQWRDSYENGYYNEDPYDDDMYEGRNLSDKLQKICDNFDIRMWDSPSSFLLIEIKRLLDDLRVTADQYKVSAASVKLVLLVKIKENILSSYYFLKAKHGSIRLEEGYERVLCGDIKLMFDPHVEDTIWRNQKDYRVLDWKIYDSCRVHSLRMQHMHIHMLVKKRHPLTPATITDMLNKKLQCDYFSKMVYQLLKLLTKQLKNQ
ncbi:hypothetical protein Tco_0785193 [Tanacetum coccineum]